MRKILFLLIIILLFSTSLVFVNTENNNFTCKESVCEFYGWKGQDKLYLNKTIRPSYFKDFKKDKDDDFIFIKKGYSDIQTRGKGKNKTILFVKYGNNWKYVVLEGVGEGGRKTELIF